MESFVLPCGGTRHHISSPTPPARFSLSRPPVSSAILPLYVHNCKPHPRHCPAFFRATSHSILACDGTWASAISSRLLPTTGPCSFSTRTKARLVGVQSAPRRTPSLTRLSCLSP